MEQRIKRKSPAALHIEASTSRQRLSVTHNGVAGTAAQV